ncbi:MAG: hypothetical protein JSV87_05775 [Candidatus Bathyarchaeota archaeon]|nr:MAG: hypothetical protein JSV87_05775 [Candidatus Bathyarchaeota archaeon]
MSLPVNGGYPQYSYADNPGGSAFIPEIWSGKLQVKFYKSTVLGEITNNDWEGEIKGMGDTVHIRSIPTITINNYSKGQTLTTETPTSTPIDLSIDKGKYFAVVVDDVDVVQADVKLMDIFSNDASEQMKIAVDNDVLNNVAADAAAANKGPTAGAISGDIDLGDTGAPIHITVNNVLEKILDVGLVLDEQNVPEDGRWMVIPSWMAPLLKNSDLKQAYLTGDDTSPLRNGKIGMIDRFTLFVSNNINVVADTVDAWHVIAGTRDAISFASQITNVETLRSTTTFGDIVRVLNVYGYSVVKPEALVDLFVSKVALP